ncbi:hypothetical protein TanjilG_24621 [Lupinus angustifolius]|uniref:Uncharacterized protein n=1 Tax=Lupinus angustifolius TaxID=3871 RepID=A0A4P1RKT3_LUPAN|nr:PREDICTED: uncharacterized protein LOC109346617 [Lupinus angustifolius]OIW12688.1 hypothetical protein TanjilG_24621 [Lupinus angustifolius]
MEKNNNSNSFMCRKIRQAFSNNLAVRAIRRISSYPHQEPKPVTTDTNSSASLSPINTAIQTNPPLPKHHNSNTEYSGASPINFDYTTMQNGNSVASSVHGYSEITTKDAAEGDDVFFKGEQKVKKSMDINDTFNEYIKRAKIKIRTVSNIGRGQNNNTSPEHETNHGTNKKENQKDQFSEFIHHAKKRFRTTTIVRKSGS